MTRRFAADPVDRQVLGELLDLARRAPSAGFSQGVHFLVLQDEDVATFWDVTGAREWFAGRQPGVLRAPVIVLPLADEGAYTSRYGSADKAGHGLETTAGWTVPYWQTDAAMATQQLLLLLEDRGLGALFFGIFRNVEELAERLGLPAGVRPIGAVAIGHREADDRPSGTPTRTGRRSLDDVVHWGRWGS